MEELLYLLPPEFLNFLLVIDKRYTEKTGVALDGPEPYAVSKLFGAKDIAKRNPSIQFIKRLTSALKEKLINNSIPLSPEELQLIAVLISACLYEKSAIDTNYWVRSSSNSVLVQAIDEALGITDTNYIDKLTRFSLLQKALGYLEGNRWTEINQALYKLYGNNDSEIPLEKWNDFKAFVEKEHATLSDSLFNYHYPTANATAFIASRVSEVAGISVGFVLGDMFGKSRPLIPVKYNIATLSSALLYSIAFQSPMATMFVLPNLTGAAVDLLFGVSGAYLVGKTLKCVGYYGGYSVGFVIDTSGHGIKYVVDSVLEYKRPIDTEKSGINLSSGMFYHQGVALAPCAFKPGTVIAISPDGIVTVDGKPHQPTSKLQAVIDELKLTLDKQHEETPHTVSSLN